MTTVRRALPFYLLLLITFHCAPAASANCALPDSATLRPTAGSAPTEVSIGLYLLDMSKVDNVAQSFGVDVMADIVWQDQRLGAVAAARGASCIYDLEQIWHPQVTIMNRRKGSTLLPATVTVTADGTVFYSQRYLGEVASPLNLRNFPYDQQNFPIVLASLFASELVNLQLDPKRTGAASNLSVAGWNILSTDISQSLQILNLELDGEPATISTVTYAFHAERDINYYLWKVALPVTVISIMSWAVFWINRKELGPTLAASSTAILTLIAFMFSLRGIQPPVSYLTRMDYFIYGALLLLFLTHFEGLLSRSLTSQGHDERAHRIDRFARWGFPAAFLSLLCWYLFSV